MGEENMDKQEPTVEKTKKRSKLFDKRMKQWQEKLLDLSKRNRMLSFRPRKSSSLRVEEDFAEIPQRLIVDNEELTYGISEAYEEDGQYDAEDLTAEYEEAKQRAKVLKNIAKKIRLADEEYGYNIGYLAYGFLEWSERDDSTIKLKSPIILIPITIEQADRFSDYKVSYKEAEDIQINPTILEKLRTDFGMTINDLEQLDLTEPAIFQKTLQLFEEQIKAQAGWKIEREMWIDTFNFQNMVILNDLKVNGSLVSENAFADTLAENKPLVLENESEIDLDHIKSKNKIQILDADSSQEEAIYRAHKGESFVIQGPPGTGKSQTITNIIAGALYDRKSVLFVSEKQAALDVVYEKLRRANLEVFCLKMHNAKQTKSNIREQLQASMDLAQQKVRIAEEEMQIYHRLDQAKLKLNEYDTRLHAPIAPINRTPYWIFGRYQEVMDAPELNHKLPLLDFDQTQNLLADFEDYLETFLLHTGEFFENGWNHYNGKLHDQAISEAEAKANAALDCYEKLEECLQRLKDYAMKKELDFAKIAAAAESLSNLYSNQAELIWIEEAWSKLKNDDLEQLQNSLQSLTQAMQTYNETLAELNQTRNDKAGLEQKLQEQLSSDAPKSLISFRKIAQRFENSYTNFFKRLGKAYHSDLAKLLDIIEAPKIKYRSARSLLQDIVKFEDAKKQISKLSTNLKKHFTVIQKSLNAQPQELPKFAQKITEQLNITIDTTKYDAENIAAIAAEVALYQQTLHILRDQLDLEQQMLTDFCAKLHGSQTLICAISIVRFAEELTQKIAACTELQNPYAQKPEDNEDSHLQKYQSLLTWVKMAQNFDWTASLRFERHQAIRKKLVEEYQIAEVLSEIERRSIPTTDVIPALRKNIYLQLLEKAEFREQYIATYNRDMHDRTIMDFREYDKRQNELAAARVRSKLIQNMPDFSGFNSGVLERGDSEIATLKREVKKRSRLMPTRKLIAKIPVILPKLKPCIMMSPITVSSYFASNPELKFDLVIFDEASQVKTETAITAIMRAKQLIVAGDSKQMPPTNFFNAASNEDEDDEELEEIAGLDSVLDELSVSMPQVYLKWHYRSRDESLIDFSNKRFYEKRLYTFPSIYAKHSDLGLNYQFVEGGIWENRSGNQIEAEKIAQLVLEHIEKCPEKSLGIVAFGKSQATAIEDAVSKMRDTYPKFEHFFSNEQDEPFFIKNLENVQGDERDKIILSVGYGKGADGKFAMRFGPLSLSGGERRLNVAISRAKEQMIVVSSFHANEIRDEEKNENRKLLKDFLEFAEHGEMELVVGDELEDDDICFDSDFEKAVYNFIISKGYQAKTQVGVSGYKIDMAIIDPKDSGHYLLAIECDGAAYHSSRTARDRDRLRQDVLEGMGWNFHRIWSTDWFYNRKEEERKLCDAIAAAISGKRVTLPQIVTKTHIKTETFDPNTNVIKKLNQLRKNNHRRVILAGSYDHLYYDCESQEVWNQAFEIALDSNFDGKTRDELSRFVTTNFLHRDRLTTRLKVFTNAAIDQLVKKGKIREVQGSLMHT